MKAPIVVFDTNVLVALFVFADSRYRPFIEAIAAGRLRALRSEASSEELRRVLAYPAFGLAQERQQALLATWQALAGLPPHPPISQAPLPRCADRDDQKFLELARDGGADWLITADKALLRLARRDRLNGLFRLLTPEAALATLAAG